MSRFFVDERYIHGDMISVYDGDYNHIKNVLRMHVGEKLVFCDGQGTDYHCTIAEFCEDHVELQVDSREHTNVELQSDIVLYQGLPKRDKLELIVQKAVELGVAGITPVMCKRTIVKLDDAKKEQRKLERLQSISESAAKQSGRGCIPQISPVLSFREAILQAEADGAYILFPYENALGMSATKAAVQEAVASKRVAIFIGPEGGFDASEVEFAQQHGAHIISLGRRILRTETAGLCLLSMLMLESELTME